MFPFGAIAATVWWKWRKWQSLRPLGRIIETNEGPAFCQSTQWRNASSSQQQCTCTCTQSVPTNSPVPLLYLLLFQYPFCTFLLSRTSSVPLQSSSTIHCLLNSYCLKIREEKCLFFKAAVHHMYPFSTFILSSTSNHCLLYHNNSKLQILFTNQLGEMPSSEKPPSSKQHCTLIPSSTSPVPLQCHNSLSPLNFYNFKMKNALLFRWILLTTAYQSSEFRV